MTHNKFFKQYRDLRGSIDKLSAKLEETHKLHIHCQKGCDLCCMDFSIFPVEFYAIRSEMAEMNFIPDTGLVDHNSPSCKFLQNHACTIYPFRPVICRTHGLPLLYTNEEGEWELSACELNFTNFGFEGFNLKNTYPQDKFNSRLYLLNKEFIAEYQEIKYNEQELVPLSKLF